MAGAGFGVLLTLLPLLYLALRIAQSDGERIARVLGSGRTWELGLNSLVLVVAVTATATLVGGAQALLVARTDLPGRSLVAVLAVLPLAVPSYVAASSWVALFPGFSGLGAAWLVLSFAGSPYAFLALTAALLQTNSSLEEVARSLGRRPLAVIRQVIWPGVRPAAAGSALLIALYTLSDFGAVSILRYDTFTRAIFTAYRASFDRTTAAVLAGIVVIATVLLAIGQQRAADANPSGNRVRRRGRLELGASGRWWLAGSLAWAAVGIGLPVASMVRWTAVGASTADAGEIWRALLNTFGFAFAGGLAALLPAYALALLATRYRSRSGRPLLYLMWVGHALPGIVVALSLVFLSNAWLPGIYQTSLLVVVAYVVLFLPNAVATLRGPLGQIPAEAEGVARSLGQSPAAVFRRVTLPLSRPALVGAYALVALTIVKELPATLLLRPTGIETLATRLWSATSVNAFAAAAPYALLLIVLAGLPALMLNREIKAGLAGERQPEVRA